MCSAPDGATDRCGPSATAVLLWSQRHGADPTCWRPRINRATTGSDQHYALSTFLLIPTGRLLGLHHRRTRRPRTPVSTSLLTSIRRTSQRLGSLLTHRARPTDEHHPAATRTQKLTADTTGGGEHPRAAGGWGTSMSTDDSAALARLRAERAETERRLAGLTGTFTDIVDASESSNADDEHDPEGSTIAFERSQVDALITQAREHLFELEAAEQRLATGGYGTCERCGQAISPARLEARPIARTCITCAGRR